MRPATKPLLLLLKSSNNHLGILVHPKMNLTLDIEGKGKFEIIGKLKDKGYEFSPISFNDFPKWISKYIPQNYFLFAYCQVITIPFVHPNGCKCEDCRNEAIDNHGS